MPDVPLLEMRAITKRFPGVAALEGVDFDLRRGEVHVLVGENGAENIFLGREPLASSWLGVVDFARMRREAAQVLQRLGLSILGNGLTLLGFSSYLQLMVTGAIFILAVRLDLRGQPSD